MRSRGLGGTATSAECTDRARPLRSAPDAARPWQEGAWRFFYEVDDGEKTVFMTVASHRGSAY